MRLNRLRVGESPYRVDAEIPNLGALDAVLAMSMQQRRPTSRRPIFCMRRYSRRLRRRALLGKELLFKQIEIAQRLHGVTEVVIVHHDNCGAYGIPDRQEEEKIQVSDLEKIHSLLNQRYPGLAVKSLIIKGTAEGDLRAEEVAFSVAA